MPNWKKVVTSGSNAVFNEITASGEVRFDGTGSFNSGIHLPDSKEISLGDGGNLKIYHNGANSYIHEGKGDADGALYIIGSWLLMESTEGNPLIYAKHGDNTGEVQLYHGGNQKFRTQATGSHVTGHLSLSGGITKAPMMISTNGEVPLESITNAFVPFSSINTMDQFTVNGYYQFAAPYDGTVQKIMVHPHTNATAGTSTIQLLKNGSNLGSSVQASISATRGTIREFTFGDTYSFDKGDRLNLKFDREEAERATGFGFTIVFEMNTTT